MFPIRLWSNICGCHLYFTTFSSSVWLFCNARHALLTISGTRSREEAEASIMLADSLGTCQRCNSSAATTGGCCMMHFTWAKPRDSFSLSFSLFPSVPRWNNSWCAFLNRMFIALSLNGYEQQRLTLLIRPGNEMFKSHRLRITKILDSRMKNVTVSITDGSRYRRLPSSIVASASPQGNP